MPRERKDIERVRGMSSEETLEEIHTILKRDARGFERIAGQLEALLASWQYILNAKRRFDGSGGFDNENMATEFLMALKIIPGRACIGLPDYNMKMHKQPTRFEEADSEEEFDGEINARHPKLSKRGTEESSDEEDSDIRQLREDIRNLRVG